MTRAVVQRGLIRPLDPPPDAWVEGHQVIVEDSDDTPVEKLETWYRELQTLGPAIYEPGEWEQVQATLCEADQKAKGFVHRVSASAWPEGAVGLEMRVQPMIRRPGHNHPLRLGR